MEEGEKKGVRVKRGKGSMRRLGGGANDFYKSMIHKIVEVIMSAILVSRRVGVLESIATRFLGLKAVDICPRDRCPSVDSTVKKHGTRCTMLRRFAPLHE